MKSIKTVNLKANEIQAVEMPDLHCHVRNGGTATVFASRYADVAPYTDGVLEIKSGDSKVVRNIFDYQTRQGFVYLFSESDTSVELESANDVNFFSRKIISGGESTGTVDTYNRSEIDTKLSEKADNSAIENISNAVNTHVNNMSVHMTTADKEKLASLENYDDVQIKNDIALNLSSIGISRKNLLKVTGATQELNGVTFTVNDDGSITVSGKNTSDTTTFYRITNLVKLPIGGSYTLNGCPANNKNNDGTSKVYWRVEKQGSVIAMDTGNGKTFTTSENANPTMAQICVYAGADFTDNPVTFYPMIRYSDVTDDTYEPYTPSVQEQINDILARLTTGGL